MALRHVAPALFRRSDDEAAFERLYERHVEGVYRYSLAMLGDASDAEDVTQTTFLNAYRAFKKGTRPEKPSSWLIAIAHNVCRQRFRQAQRRPREVAFDEGIGEAEILEPAGPTADELRRALSELPPNQRAALVMRELEGSSYAEIAGVLGVSVSALESLLFRARRSFREQLEEQISCQEAALAINRQLDGRLSMGERRALRAHLRACADCNSLAQSQRAQRRALKSLVIVPLPLTIAHWSGATSASAATGGAGTAGGLTAVGATTGGAASTVFGGAGLAAKVAAVVVAGVAVGGGTYEGVTHAAAGASKPAARTGAALEGARGQQRGISADEGTSMNSAGVPVVLRTEHDPVAASRTAANLTRADDNAAKGKKATAHGQAVKPVATSAPHKLLHPHDEDVSASHNAAHGNAATENPAATQSQSAAHTQAATHMKAATQSQSAANTRSGSNPQAAVHSQATTHDKAATQSQSAAHTQASTHSEPPAGAKSSPDPKPAPGERGKSSGLPQDGWSSSPSQETNTSKGKSGSAAPETTTTATPETSSETSPANGSRGKP